MVYKTWAGEVIPGLIHITVTQWLGPKVASRTLKLVKFLKKMLSQIKKVKKKAQDQNTLIWRLIIPSVWQHKCMGYYEEKMHKKKEEKEAAEYAKLLVKRGKEVEKKQIVKRHGLSLPKASKSEYGQKCLWE